MKKCILLSFFILFILRLFAQTEVSLVKDLLINCGATNKIFNPVTDDNTSSVVERGDPKNVRFRSYRQTNFSSSKDRYLSYSFKPDSVSVPNLKPGKYQIQVQFFVQKGKFLNAEFEIDGKVIIQRQLYQATPGEAKVFTMLSDPFLYTGGAVNFKCSAGKIENGDRLSLSFVKLLNVSSVIASTKKGFILEDKEQRLSFNKLTVSDKLVGGTEITIADKKHQTDNKETVVFTPTRYKGDYLITASKNKFLSSNKIIKVD